MIQALDQIFVLAKQWLLAWLAVFPAWVGEVVGTFINIAAVLGVYLTLFAIVSVFERKILARIQNRYGPNRVGPFGLLQPVADGIKMLIKEDIVPRNADHVVHFIAPIAMVVPAIFGLGIIPVGRNMTPFTIEAGILFYFAVSSVMELSVFMAGWASNNKFSMIGAMRAIAQMVSYEIPLILAAIPVVMVVSSLKPDDIIAAQAGYTHGLPNWFVMTPWGFAAAVFFLIAALVESNRSPFDLPEGESELVAGHMTEYSGFKYATFFMAEYLGMFAVSGIAVTLFLGGWHAPFAWLGWVPSWMWFFGKLGAMVFFYIWVRGTLPRMRFDQLMNFAWKFLLPMTFVCIVAAAAWHYMGRGPAGWGTSALMVVLAYFVLSRALSAHLNYRPRVYRYAE
jgi:NADH-quinone oxidoreductase subunit H